MTQKVERNTKQNRGRSPQIFVINHKNTKQRGVALTS